MSPVAMRSAVLQQRFFITFEGIEGAGKSSQIELLHQHLRAKGYDLLVTREPGGTPLADQIRQMLLHSPQAIPPWSELLLFCAARVAHLQEVIVPALQAKKIVLCDRFMDASTAYQGYGRGLPLDAVAQLHHLVVATNVPDLTLIFDLDPEIALPRVAARTHGAGLDRIETEALEFHRKVRQGYRQIAAENPQRCLLIDATLPIASMQQLIIAKVERALEQKR